MSNRALLVLLCSQRCRRAEQGEVVCTKQVGDKPPREVMRLSNGMYFGEVRAATQPSTLVRLMLGGHRLHC